MFKHVLCLVALVAGVATALPAQAGVIVNSGGSVIFQFDAGAAPIGTASSVSYVLTTTDPNTGGAPSAFNGSFALYDELGEPPLQLFSANFAPAFTSSVSFPNPSFAGLLDDPISYLVVNFNSLLPSGSVAEFAASVTFEIAGARFVFEGTSVAVPEPGSLALLGLGLGTKLRRFKHPRAFDRARVCRPCALAAARPAGRGRGVHRCAARSPGRREDALTPELLGRCAGSTRVRRAAPGPFWRAGDALLHPEEGRDPLVGVV